MEKFVEFIISSTSGKESTSFPHTFSQGFSHNFTQLKHKNSPEYLPLAHVK